RRTANESTQERFWIEVVIAANLPASADSGRVAGQGSAVASGGPGRQAGPRPGRRRPIASGQEELATADGHARDARAVARGPDAAVAVPTRRPRACREPAQ